MPCHDSRDDDDRALGAMLRAAVSPERVIERDTRVEAILCGILSAYEREFPISEVFDAVDWAKVGLPRSFAEAWWEAHKLMDEAKHAR